MHKEKSDADRRRSFPIAYYLLFDTLKKYEISRR